LIDVIDQIIKHELAMWQFSNSWLLAALARMANHLYTLSPL
jgi:hypothetical protein